MHLDPQEFVADMAGFLGWYYVVVAACNAGAVWYCIARRRFFWMLVWAAVTVGFAVAAYQAFDGRAIALDEAVKTQIDAFIGPVSFTVGTFVFLVVMYLGRSFFVLPAVAWAGLNAALLFMGVSMTDPEFAAVVTKPDNVPIVAMVFLLGIFTWWGTAQAVENDRRLAQGRPPLEKDYDQKVLVWPDVVYLELIGMIIATVVLLVWSLAIQAPLEEPANPVVTPNPSKAPWYFLGLQEMLVYFDASIAGVILPVLMIVGLMAVPYLDFNEKGDGYYTIKQRRFAYIVFQFGFLQLWILLILIGTFMRGPNWCFFGLYEFRDPHKIVAASNIKLSELFWSVGLGQSVPQVAAGAGFIVRTATIIWREIAGLTFLGVYFVALPVLLSRTLLRSFYRQMGVTRYTIMIFMLLMMLMLPIKMVLRWTLNVSYIVSLPEYFANF
ncbi:MAG: hypothetical protein JXM70_05180 [Pirellulales bacterium]|nr:hypothetical protein [Pirellulales bacterium]